MKDANLVLRSSGVADLTADVTTASIDIGPSPRGGFACIVTVPEQTVGDTLAVNVQHSSDDTTFTTVASMFLASTATALASTAPSVQLVRHFETEYRYVRAQQVLLGTSPDYGSVIIEIGHKELWQNLALGRSPTVEDTVV